MGADARKSIREALQKRQIPMALPVDEDDHALPVDDIEAVSAMLAPVADSDATTPLPRALDRPHVTSAMPPPSRASRRPTRSNRGFI